MRVRRCFGRDRPDILAGDHDHGRVAAVLDLLKKLHALGVGQVVVRQNVIKALQVLLQRIAAVADADGGVGSEITLEGFPDQFALIGIILDDQEPDFRHVPTFHKQRPALNSAPRD